MKTLIFALALLLPISAGLPQNLPAGFDGLPVLITLSNGKMGSGFYVTQSNYVYLATARHVLMDPQGNLAATNAALTSHRRDGTNRGQAEIRLDLAGLLAIKEIRTHPVHDVAVVRFAMVDGTTSLIFDTHYVRTTNNGVAACVPVRSSDLCKLNEIRLADEILVFGYPVSIGLSHSPRFNYSKPLMRRGIVAGIYDEKQTIVVDSSVYFGNSGGPVVVRRDVDIGVSRFQVIGIVSELIPFVEYWKSSRFEVENVNVSNSGYAVVEPADFILELLWQ